MAHSERARRLVVPLVAFLVGLAVLGTAMLVTLSPGRRPASSVGGPFSLVDQNGTRVSDKDFKGRPHLVFFGFTHCPDVCPTTLFQISEVLKATGDRGRDLRVLFISVDPERDTPAALRDYLSSFDPRIVALTGTPAEIESTVKAFRAYSRKVPTKDGDYTMEHTSAVYLMDRDGRLVSTFNLARPPEDAARDLLAQT